MALSAVAVGKGFTVTRIPEELEFTPGLLDFLEDAAVQPGHTGVVTAVSPDGTTTVEIDGRHVGIGFRRRPHPGHVRAGCRCGGRDAGAPA